MRYQFVNLFKALTKQQPTENKKDYYEDITVWGFGQSEGRKGNYLNNNDFPQQIIQDVYNSPVASTALELWVEFIFGKGFTNEELNDKKANEETSYGELLYKIAYDVAHLDGFAVHVSYNALGEKTALSHQPFEQTRLGQIKGGVVQEIKTNPYYGIPYEYDKKYSKTFYTFNDDPAFVRNQMATHAQLKREGKVKHDYCGQIFWVSIEKPLARIYPQPFYYSGINWFRIDAEIQKFHERNIKNNLIQSHILNVYGDPDEAMNQDDENGDAKVTRGELFDEMLNAKARGADNGGGQLINWFTNEEEKLVPEAFPTNANDQLFQTLQDLTTSQISIATNVPTILLNIQQEGKLGSSQEIINSVRLMQAKVKPKQKFIEKNLSRLFGVDVNIKDTNLINVLPEWAFTDDTLSRDEKRKYLEDKFDMEISSKNGIVISENGNDVVAAPEESSSRFSEFGVGGVQGILEIQKAVAEGTASQEAAVKTLMIIYGFDEQTSKDMLGILDNEEIKEKPIKQDGN